MADYRALAIRLTRMAFKRAGTLCKKAVFLQKNPPAFNFGSAEVVEESVPLSLNVDCIILTNRESKERNKEESVNGVKRKIMVITEDVPGVDSYDKVTIDGVTWGIVFPIVDDGITTTLILSKEL